MPDEDIETAELKESVEASVEQALEAEREQSGWTMYLSLSTAIIAVFAAVASLESGANSNDAILAKNDAVLNQSLTSDQWALYQAKAMRAAIASGESEFASATNPERPGKPRPAKPAITKPTPKNGADFIMPPISSMLRV